MNTEAAKALIVKFHQDGLSNVEIAKRLQAKGYVSPRTGKPINQFGVGFHVRNAMAKKAAPIRLAAERKPDDKPAPRIAKTRLQLALEVLEAPDLDPAEKVELSQRLLKHS
jgi:hypothetical protein